MNHRDLLGSAARDAESDAKAYEIHEHGPYPESVKSCRDRAAEFLSLADKIDAKDARIEKLEGALREIRDKQSRWPAWSYQDIYEDSQNDAIAVLLSALNPEETKGGGS